MMGGGGGTTTWMVGEVATEDEDEEGLDSTEGVICGLVVGDRTSGVRGFFSNLNVLFRGKKT
jgi:hypothetical protein